MFKRSSAMQPLLARRTTDLILFVSIAILPPSYLQAQSSSEPKRVERPNVILIMSDDQGGGDYGFLGNAVIRTPELDAMFEKSALLSRFYVSPVCAPTRASLMTGRYNYRTRCIDTYIGRAMMDPAEVTIAELLKNAGYRTGIYGKWHLGDNYPMRPMDQGFEESLVHRGGGIGQPSDPVGAEGKYTDPTLFRNGAAEQIKGYCTDIYFDSAMDFIEGAVGEEKNFFTYIATNAPHGPFHDVPQDLYEEYSKADFGPILISEPNPKRKQSEMDKLARIAAMITNIDENVGQLFRKLDELSIRENTIVLYMNDNGPNTSRYVGNMRGRKSHVDDGGIRSPLLFHWPKRIESQRSSDVLCAHIDVLPTILDACNVPVPAGLNLDGRSFLPLLTEEHPEWGQRQVVFQTHRGNEPQKFHHFAIHEDPWKLVHPSGFGNENFDGEPKLELYNLRKDPRQQVDLASSRPEVLQRLKSSYERWFEDVSTTRPDNYAPPRIVIGTEFEASTVLTRQDWRHTSGQPWGRKSNGFWLLEAPGGGEYEVEVILKPDHPGGNATISVQSERDKTPVQAKVVIASDQIRGHSVRVALPAGKLRLSASVNYGGEIAGPHQVVLTRVK